VKPVFGGIFLVAGMVIVITVPIVGVALLGVGYWMLESSTARQKQASVDTFFGIALLCMVITGVLALIR
jgi:hypothetical protein